MHSRSIACNTFINAIQNFELMQLTEKDKLVLEKFEKFIYENNPSNILLVKIIELAGSYLNLQTISDHSKSNNISYNGAKKFREKIKLFNVFFIIDNK